MDEPLDLSSISFEDLQEEYVKLRERYSQLVVVNEQDTQRIHELRRNLDTAIAAEQYLSQELEQLSSVNSSQDDALVQKKQNEIDELRKRQSALLTENEDLHQDIADLRAENQRLCEKIKELSQASQTTEISYRIPKEHIELRERLEEENLVLLAKLDETHETVVKFTMSLAEKEKHIEILKDQVVCLEENLQSKREEVDEKSQLLESAQEQVVEMNAKIAMLTSCPDNADRKGNSLFAEVDDQRQAMKQLLSDQKKSYLQMKKVYKDSQQEIRRLKSENIAMHTELQACSTIFCSADKAYKEKLNERILSLLKQNEDLEKKLMITQQELISLANDKGVVWLDSMLLFCKQETDDLKNQLRSVRIQMGILEERLRNTQQDLAKWRFEALKSRCILIDRESLLGENNIEFRKFTNRDVSFTESELENAKPSIGIPKQPVPQGSGNQTHSSISQEAGKEARRRRAADRSPELIKIEDDDEALESQDQIISDVAPPEVKQADEALPSKQECSDLHIKKEIIEIDCEPSECTPVETRVVLLHQDQPNVDKSNSNIPNTSSCKSIVTELTNLKIKSEPSEEDNKENTPQSLKPPFQLPALKEQSPRTITEAISELKPRPSILVTKRNIFDDDTTMKAVRFAQVDTAPDCDLSSKPKSVFKSTRTKSNVIVRRIIVSSKVKREAATPPAPE